ncbi:MAG: hypothetical protein HC828_01280 [Blastochloris sp.]|nr:hypothetical protein [Blastochloris sp.]
MAEIAPERVVTTQPPRRYNVGRTINVPLLGSIPWLPPLLLAVITVLAMLAAYSIRPSVQVDLGDYYDSAYLNLATFNDREIGAIGQGTSIDWPAMQERLVVPGDRSGVWVATLYAADDQPDDVLRFVGMTANGERLQPIRPTTPDPETGELRRDPRKFLSIIPPEVAAAGQLELGLVHVLRGNEPPTTEIVQRVELAPAQTFRWSQGDSVVHLPGLGRGAWQVSLTALVHHPDNAPVDATVFVNGTAMGRLPERGELRELTFFVPPSLMSSGDLTIRIASQTFDDPRPLGVRIHEIRVTPAGSGMALPPLSSLLYGLTIALGIYWCGARLTQRRAPSMAFALVILLVGVGLLAVARYPTVFMLPRLAVLFAWSIGLLLVLERLLPWAFQRAGVPISPRFSYALLFIFFVGYWLKAGGMLYPYFVGVDVGWHMARVQEILDGQLGLFYSTNSPLNESTMPAAEWGESRPVIPYSPWFHIFATSFTLLPLPLSLTGYLFGALLDTSQVFLIALLARKTGFTAREALLGVLLFAITPSTFLLHSWGNLPTTFGLWWTMVATVYVVVAYQHLHERRPFIMLTLLFTAVLLAYTVTATFMLFFLGLLVPALWLFTPQGESRRSAMALGLAGLAGLGVATLIYYGQYIAPIIQQTIPYLTQAAAPGEGVTGVTYDPFGLYVEKYWWRMSYFDLDTNSYGLQLTLPLGLIGIWLARSRQIKIMFACWLAVALVFLVVGSRISMVDKHLFYLIPGLALGVGLIFGRIWRRGLWGRVATITFYTFTFLAALQVWFYRIATVQQ